MSYCFTQVFASFDPVDPSLTLDNLLSHLQQVIASEVHNDEFDVAGAYAGLIQSLSQASLPGLSAWVEVG